MVQVFEVAKYQLVVVVVAVVHDFSLYYWTRLDDFELWGNYRERRVVDEIVQVPENVGTSRQM